jgi:hypothetical protein
MIAAALPIAHAMHVSFGRTSMLVAADSQLKTAHPTRN